MSPSIAFVATDSWSGSGVLIEGGFVVTNAHVVWPYKSMRVVFPDGSEITDAPVKAWDLLADLAILGPIEVAAPPLELIADGPPAIGEATYLIGYPAEFESFPQPAITSGLVSRVREWEPVGLSYIQTDAPIAGGQSGGALVSHSGEVIGISGFKFSEADFGLVASMEDIYPRIQTLIAGEEPAAVGRRLVHSLGDQRRHVGALSNSWDRRAYVLTPQSGAVVEVEVNSNSDVGLSIYNTWGRELLHLDDYKTGSEAGSLIIDDADTYFLVVSQISEGPGRFTVDSNHSLTPLDDPDDGRVMELGRQIGGNIDFPRDVDYFFLRLKEGETVEVTASANLIDPFLYVDYPGAPDDQVVSDDDSGEGFFGIDSTIVYRARHTESYLVVIKNVGRGAPGGYVITADRADEDAELTSAGEDSAGDDADDTLVPGGHSQFGVAELRSAFESLPETFEEEDPPRFGFTFGDPWIKDLISFSMSFSNSDPFQIVVGLTGEISDLGQIAVDAVLASPQRFLDSVVRGLLGVETAPGDDFGRQDRGILSVSTIGDAAVGLWVDTTSARRPLRMELIMFRRENQIGLVYVYYRPGSVPLVSIHEAAGILDQAISEYYALKQQ